MASVIRQLSDDDVEAVHHMIRRDANSDLEIAAEVERRLGREISSSDHGREMVVARYRQSQHYRKWLRLWQDREIRVMRHTKELEARVRIVAKAIEAADLDAGEGVAKALQARLLTLAVEADDDELKAASSGRGWIVNALKLQVAIMRDQWRRQVNELKQELLRRAEELPKAARKSLGEVVDRVDEIMGLKKG